MKTLGTQILETERLRLRPFREEDAEPMFRNWANDPAVTRYLTWPTHQSVENTRAVVALWTAESRDPGIYQWAIELKSLGEPIGSLSAMHPDTELGSVELGYCIGSAWWGQGLTAEAVRAAIAFLVRREGFHRVAARHDSRNPNSGRVMQKAGMKREGVLRASGRSNSGLGDMVWYAILAEELDRAGYEGEDAYGV